MATPEERKCKSEGCDKYAVKEGLCKAHYQQQLPNKTATKSSVKKPYVCSTSGCGRAVQKDGLYYKCFKEKNGHAPYGKGASVKTRTVKKPVSVKAPSNGASASADELQALIRKAGKEALRVEIMPLIEQILEVLR